MLLGTTGVFLVAQMFWKEMLRNVVGDNCGCSRCWFW